VVGLSWQRCFPSLLSLSLRIATCTKGQSETHPTHCRAAIGLEVRGKRFIKRWQMTTDVDVVGLSWQRCFPSLLSLSLRIANFPAITPMLNRDCTATMCPVTTCTKGQSETHPTHCRAAIGLEVRGKLNKPFATHFKAYSCSAMSWMGFRLPLRTCSDRAHNDLTQGRPRIDTSRRMDSSLVVGMICHDVCCLPATAEKCRF
jgi:hypothetical protein